MGDFIGLCVIAVLALSPLLRRFYIDRFWVHTRGTVIRVEGIINNIPERGEWVWAPIIEYQAAEKTLGGRTLNSEKEEAAEAASAYVIDIPNPDASLHRRPTDQTDRAYRRRPEQSNPDGRAIRHSLRHSNCN